MSIPLRPAGRVRLAALLALTALACGREESAEMSATKAERILDSPNAVSVVQDFAGRGVESGTEMAMRGLPQGGSVPISQAPIVPGQMLIRNGYATVRVDSLELAMTAVHDLATRLGGSVGNVSMSLGELEVRSATLQLRVPSERFDEAMGGMAPLGRVESSLTRIQDVGEEFVDLNVRMANSRRLETRLLELLANRTGRLEDVLAVERELARVRQEIERSEGRLRYLGARVSMSTLEVTVRERGPVTGGQPGENVIVQAFVGAWHNFVGFVAWVIESLGVVIPVALVGWLALRAARGRRRRTVD